MADAPLSLCTLVSRLDCCLDNAVEGPASEPPKQKPLAP